MAHRARLDVDAFFASLTGRRFSDAEASMEDARRSGLEVGYAEALGGMLTSAKSGDARDFLNRAVYDKESMEKYVRDLQRLLREGMPKAFDVGFLSAWTDLMKFRMAQLRPAQRRI